MIRRISLFRLLSIGVFGAGCLLAADVARTKAPELAKDPELWPCSVTPEDEAKISAEEAGVLMHLAVKHGKELTAGELIGKIDDREAVLKRSAAEAGWQAAAERYNSEIEIKYARKSSEVAKVAYEKMLAANRGTPNTITDLEVRKAKLEWDTAELQIEKAIKDQSIAKFDMGTKRAEYDLGELGMKRRTILAPFNGVVVDVFRHQNEWLNPGDPIVHLMRLDTMRVEQNIKQSEFDPQEIYGCKVTVELELARGRKEKFSGQVTYVSPVLSLSGRSLSYVVRAEVANRTEAGQWILRPNHEPKMTIHLGTNGAAGAGVGRLRNQ